MNNLGDKNGNDEGFTIAVYFRDCHRHLESTKSMKISSDREQRLIDIEQFAVEIEWYYLLVDIAEFEGNRYGDPEGKRLMTTFRI